MSAKERLEAMIAGTDVDIIEEDDTQVETADESVNEAVENDTTDNVGDEDTDQDTESSDETETEEENDDSAKETEEEDDKGEEEDAHTTTDDESENTKVEDAVDEINYKEFYEKVALAKFTANGREVEGFKNPEDLIRAQQMLHGYSDKMRVFKEFKKFIKPLEERKILENQDKFNLAMSLIDGDTEAIKQVIKDKGIDPLELDLDNIAYVPKNTIATDTQLLFEEVYGQARNLGIEDKFHVVLTNEFDDASLQEFMQNKAVRDDLIQHLQTGVYDVVKDEIRRMEMIDTTGELDGFSTVDKYRLAVKRLQEKQSQQSAAPKQVVPEVQKTPQVDAKAKQAQIDAAKAEAEFKKKAAEKEAEIAAQRNKAAALSKTKAVKKAPEPVKPEALKGDEFRDYFKNMMMR